jgi:hypothetical protein
MSEVLSALPLGQLSAGALVALIVLSILRGGLVPRQQLIDTRADRDKWRETAEKGQAAVMTLGMSVEKILTAVELTNHAIIDIRELALRSEKERDR